MRVTDSFTCEKRDRRKCNGVHLLSDESKSFADIKYVSLLHRQATNLLFCHENIEFKTREMKKKKTLIITAVG